MPVLVAGGLVTAAALALALPRTSQTDMPKVAVVSAAFFVVSLINVPVGPTSVHLVLSVLIGLVLGWAMVPAIFVGLILQAVFFGFGGITTLGLTTVNIALPGLFWGTLFRRPINAARTALGRSLLAGLAAALAIGTSALLVVTELGLSDRAYLASAPLVMLTYLAAGEAVITGFAVTFLHRVMPEALRTVPVAGHA